MRAFLLFLFLLTAHSMNAQEATRDWPRHHLLLEGGGICGFGSLSYEYLLKHRENWHLSTSIGLSTIRLRNFKNDFQPDLIIPIQLLLRYGEGSHHPEVGIAHSFHSIVKFDVAKGEAKREGNMSSGLLLGYRFQNMDGWLIVKANYYLIYENYDQWRHWPGVCIGYAF